MRKFFAKHRTFGLILLGYLAPILIIAWLIALYFFFRLAFPSNPLGNWFLEISVKAVLFYLLWLFIWTLGLVSYATFSWTRQPLKPIFGKVWVFIKNRRKNWRFVLLFFFISALLTIVFSVLGSLIEKHYKAIYFGIPLIFYRSSEWGGQMHRDFSFYSLLGNLLFWFLIASIFYWLRRRFRLSLIALFLIWGGVAWIGGLVSSGPGATAFDAPSYYLVRHVKVLNPWERYWAAFRARSGRREAVTVEFLESEGKSHLSGLTEEERAELRVLLDRFDAENPRPTVEEAFGVWRCTLNPVVGFLYGLALSILSWGIVGLIITGVGRLGLKGFQRLKHPRVAPR